MPKISEYDIYVAIEFYIYLYIESINYSSFAVVSVSLAEQKLFCN